MNYYDVLKIAGNNAHKSMNAISKELDHPSNYIANAKARGSVPTVVNAALMLKACGYVLAAIPFDSVQPDMLVID